MISGMRDKNTIVTTRPTHCCMVCFLQAGAYTNQGPQWTLGVLYHEHCPQLDATLTGLAKIETDRHLRDSGNKYSYLKRSKNQSNSEL